MNKLIISLILSFCIIGCQKITPPSPRPVPVNPAPLALPNSVKEEDNGKTFLVNKGANITFSLIAGNNEEVFWAFSALDGDFEVLSDVRHNGIQTLILKVNSSGKIDLQFCRFSETGVVVTSRLSFGVKLR